MDCVFCFKSANVEFLGSSQNVQDIRGENKKITRAIKVKGSIRTSAIPSFKVAEAG